ncbi:MAG TPA: alanine racemase [Candidatus Macondimonas sp.]|nr:alanine racemase [Candidatus Macondimonas sp.]
MNALRRGAPWIEVDLAALTHNLAVVRRHAAGARMMAVVKADAYGHGLLAVAPTLAAHADALAVARLDEALQLRAGGVRGPVTVLEGVFDADGLQLAAQLGLELVVHHPLQVNLLESASLPDRVRVWLKVDTGMGRLGVAVDEAGALWRRLAGCPAVAGPVGWMTHLAHARRGECPETDRQLSALASASKGLAGPRNIANSAGILAWPQTHADWVRPGIMLYGVSPFAGEQGADAGLRPVMSLCSELIAVKRLRAGDAVGYGGTWRAPQATCLGVVAVGYGDGYPRTLPSGTPVWVNGRPVPLVGRVSMDLLTVDLGPQATETVGARAVLWGNGGASVESLAASLGTIGYELLCRITPRVQRIVLAEEVGAQTAVRSEGVVRAAATGGHV